MRPDLVPSGEQSSVGLLEDFPEYDPIFDPINRVFLPRADIATETLVAGLVELGWEVDDVTAYRTVRAAPPAAETREAIKTGGFDAVLFTSSSTVRNLVGIAGKPHASTVVACIGPATAKTAEEHGLRVDVLAETPSVAALAEALAEHGDALRLAAARAGRAGVASEQAPRCGPAQGDLIVGLPGRASAAPAAHAGPAAAGRRDPPAPGRSGAAAVRPPRALDAAGADLVDARRRAAHPRVAAGSRRGGGRRRRRRRHAVRACRRRATPSAARPATRTASSTSRSRDVRAEVGDALVVMADLCLDEFTDHGHCGVLDDDGGVDNDATLVRYAEMAMALADAGADVVGTSGMMDGQVGAVRVGARRGRRRSTSRSSRTPRSTPPRSTARSARPSTSQLQGDRRTYQQDPANRRESLREVRLDVEEGADIVMVKPASLYLDVLREVAGGVDVPVAAYQVCGEYAMVEAAAERGWIDRDRAIVESLTSIHRAGADVVLTYWAAEVARWLAEGRA